MSPCSTCLAVARRAKAGAPIPNPQPPIPEYNPPIVESRLATVIVFVIVIGSVIAGIFVGARRDDSPDSVDLIVYNGRVFTGAGQPRAEALAIKGNEIVHVGTNRDLKKLRGRGTTMLDAHGGAVLPGFNDSHVHFVSGGLGLERVNLLDAETLDAIKEKIRAFAAANPDRPWVLGRGWYYSPFPGGLPTREMLDELVPDRPAYMTCYDGHTSWANSKALELAGITKDTADPANGIVVRDPKTGEPTGVLKEAAMGLMAKVLPETTPADRLRAIRAAVKEANRLGITSVQEAGTGASADRAVRRRAEVRRPPRAGLRGPGGQRQADRGRGRQARRDTGAVRHGPRDSGGRGQADD